MKVRELIERLQALDPELLAVTPGFDESGLDPVRLVEPVTMVDTRHGNPHIGRYTEIDGHRPLREGETPIQGVIVNY